MVNVLNFFAFLNDKEDKKLERMGIFRELTALDGVDGALVNFYA